MEIEPQESLRSERCIECEELELARVRDERPGQTLPIPEAALDGLPEGRESGSLTRRHLLKGGVAGFASVYGGSRLLGFEEIFESAVAEAAPGDDHVLVLLYLAGGNDGLNCLIPGPNFNGGADLAAYQAARPTIHRVLGDNAGGFVGSQPVPNTGDQFRWANNLLHTSAGGTNPNPSFEALYGDGTGGAGSDLAVLPAVDYTPANLSHFDSSDYWFAGALQGLSTGWLGRWIDRNGSDTNPLQAISIDTALSKAIRTQSKPVCALPSVSSLGFRMNVGGYGMPNGAPGNANINAEMAALGAVPAGAQNLYLARSRSAYDLAVDVQGAGTTINATPAPPATYPAGSSLSTRLQLAARIIQAGLGTRIITIHWGSFDTHGSQIASQDPQLTTLSQALAAFKADLTARGVEQRVVTLGFSEFGRRVEENGSGTDHGAGGLMFASGSAVKGGLASEFPGCEAADVVNGNLKVTTDFRAVYQNVLEDWLGGDLTGVLPGGGFGSITHGNGGDSLFD